MKQHNIKQDTPGIRQIGKFRVSWNSVIVITVTKNPLNVRNYQIIVILVDSHNDSFKVHIIKYQNEQIMFTNCHNLVQLINVLQTVITLSQHIIEYTLHTQVYK